MLDRLKKFFKLNNYKRAFLLLIVLLTAMSTIVFGGIFYAAPTISLGPEYAGGAEYVISVNVNNADEGEDNKKLADQIAVSIKERIDTVGVKGVTANAENNGDNSNIRVVYPGVSTNDEKNDIEKLIVDKPSLTFTDIYGNALFNYRGTSNFPTGSTDPNGAIKNIDDINYANDSRVPLANGGASNIYDTAHKVQVKLKDDTARDQWGAATAYVSGLGDGKNNIVAWINLDEFIEKAKTDWPEDWAASGRNPYNFAFVGNSPGTPGTPANADTGAAEIPGKPNTLKKFTIDASEYLVSNATVTSALRGETFLIEGGNMTAGSAATLARQINYGVSNYSLETISSTFINAEYGSRAWSKVLIAGIIILALIGVFLVVNYGILGLVSLLTIALYTFCTIAAYNWLGGIMSAQSVAALIIGIGIAVDSNIILFERFKSEIYSGNSVTKSLKSTNKKTLSTIFDANITTLLVAVILFYFGTKDILGLSLTLIISIFFTLVVVLGVTRLITNLMLNSGVFNDRKHLLGIKKEFDTKFQAKLDKVDYVKTSKWFAIGSFGILIIAGIVFSATAGAGGSVGNGFVLSQQFAGGTILEFSPSGGGAGISQLQFGQIQNILTTNGVDPSEMSLTYASDGSGLVSAIKVSVPRDLDINAIRTLVLADTGLTSDITMYTSNTSTAAADELVKNAMIAIMVAIGAIIIYTIIRFKWTFALAAIIALAHDALMVTAIFVIFRIQIDPVFIAAILSTIGYSINDTIVTFDRIREKMEIHKSKLDKDGIKNIANSAVRDTVKRSLYTSLTTTVAIIVLMSFGNATKWSFNLALLIGAVAGTYSSIFIATNMWVKLETIKYNTSIRREKKGYWNVHEVEEQTFVGINDFKI